MPRIPGVISGPRRWTGDLYGGSHEPEGSYIKLVREGQYAAEVEVNLIDAENGWSPYLSLEDARKLDAVREALRHGDIATASASARVFSLTPISR